MRHVTIRHAEPRDLDAIHAIYNSPKAMAGTLQLPYPSLALWQKRLTEIPAGMTSLVAELDGQVVGQLSLQQCPQVRRKHVGTIGMGVHDRFQGQGIGSQLLAAAVDMADNWLNLSRLELEVYTDNQAALALYRKFGFVIEGEAVEHAFRNGELVNSYFMARLKGR